MNSYVLTHSSLSHLNKYINADENSPYYKISEVNINRVGEVWIDFWGEEYQRKVIDPNITMTFIEDMMSQIAKFRDLPYDMNTNPIVACQLPNGHRFQGTIGPSTPLGVVISIRVKRPFKATHKDFNITDKQWNQILSIVDKGGNIAIIGGTSTGKTTLLNVIGREIDKRKRIGIIEDTQEIELPHENQFRHIAKRFAHGTGLGWDSKMDSVIRENPDVVICGELSIFNAFPSFNIMNLGNETFLFSAHADDELELLDGFKTRVMLAGHKSDGIVRGLVRRLDAIILVGREGEKRVIKSISHPKDLPWETLEEGYINQSSKSDELITQISMNLKKGYGWQIPYCQLNRMKLKLKHGSNITIPRQIHLDEDEKVFVEMTHKY